MKREKKLVFILIIWALITNALVYLMVIVLWNNVGTKLFGFPHLTFLQGIIFITSMVACAHLLKIALKKRVSTPLANWILKKIISEYEI